MLTKTIRQLIIFHVFIYAEVFELEEYVKFIKVSKKTLMRDIKDLEDAGLINVHYSKELKGYIHVKDGCIYPRTALVLSDNKARNRHLKKINRLGRIMEGLCNHTEVPYWEEEFNNQKSCRDWYEENFPEMSRRTMQRDFAELKKIDYHISYDFFEQCYYVDFPLCEDGITIVNWEVKE